MKRDPLTEILSYLQKKNVDIVFATYIGSYGTKDWIEGSSDYDIFLVVYGDKKPKIPVGDDIDLTIITLDEIELLRNSPIIIEIAYSSPLIDKIGLKEWCKQNITIELIQRLLNNVEEKLMSMLRDPDSHIGACPIILYSCLREIMLILSYVCKRKVTIKEIEERLTREYGVFPGELQRIKMYYNSIIKGSPKRSKINFRACIPVAEKLLDFLRSEVKQALTSRINKT